MALSQTLNMITEVNVLNDENYKIGVKHDFRYIHDKKEDTILCINHEVKIPVFSPYPVVLTVLSTNMTLRKIKNLLSKTKVVGGNFLAKVNYFTNDDKCSQVIDYIQSQNIAVDIYVCNGKQYPELTDKYKVFPFNPTVTPLCKVIPLFYHNNQKCTAGRYSWFYIDGYISPCFIAYQCNMKMKASNMKNFYMIHERKTFQHWSKYNVCNSRYCSCGAY